MDLSIINILALTFLIEKCNALTLTPTDLRKCDPTKQYSIDLKLNLTRDLRFDGIGNITKPFDNPGTIKIEISPDGTSFLPLSIWHEKNLCKTLNNFGSSLWHDIQRAAKVSPVGQCPIKQGVYSVRNIKIQMDRTVMQGLPRGVIKITGTVFDQTKRNIEACYILGYKNF